MLASVAERTAEVGIRHALGASRHDVGAQFLVEAARRARPRLPIFCVATDQLEVGRIQGSPPEP